MTSATEVLRRMLDERGVEWEDMSIRPYACTSWRDPDGEPCTALEGADDIPDGKLSVQALLTPEQAIAATLGTGTCHDLAVTPAYRDKTEFKCSECGYEYSAVGGFGCDSGDEPDFNYCPNCGRRIVDPTTNDVDVEVEQ